MFFELARSLYSRPMTNPAATAMMRHEHRETLSISMLRRRMSDITPHEAALLVECSRWLLTGSVSHAARRNGRRDGARYVEHSPADG